MDMMARPVRERMRFSTTTKVTITRMKPMVKVASLLLLLMPSAPLMMMRPPSPNFSEAASLKEKCQPLASTPRYRAFMTFLMISPKASVTMAR